MNRPNPDVWSGSHGVRVKSPLALGRCVGDPLAEASIEVAALPPGAATGQFLWEIRETVPTPDGPVPVDQRLHRHPDGTYALKSTSGHALTVDPGTGRVTVDGRDDGVRSLLVTTFALPLLLSDAPVLVVHASACLGADGALLFCGPSGRGKSSALVGLVDAGWRAVSEDLCVIDLRTTPAMVWPGPPWVRRGHGQAGPRGSAPRFEAPDKVAWDIASAMVDGPVPLAEMVFLDEPGGTDVEQESLDTGEVVRRLARHALWLGHPDERGRRLFGPTVDVANQVRASRLRLPVSDSWLERLLAVLPPGGTAAG